VLNRGVRPRRLRGDDDEVADAITPTATWASLPPTRFGWWWREATPTPPRCCWRAGCCVTADVYVEGAQTLGPALALWGRLCWRDAW